MQQEYFGIGSIEKMDGILTREKPSKIFLVTGKSSYASSGVQRKLEPILSSYQYVRFHDFSVNPKIEDIEKGIEIYKREGCDLIIAIGGGSVIDVAKSINALSFQRDNPRDYVYGKSKLLSKGNSLVAIPTTAGTGSEATHFAVIYIDGEKHSLAHQFILPDYAIVDPSLTFNLPKKITAVTGMDTLAQAVESYWAVNSTEESKKYAKESINLVMPNIETAVNNPTRESRIAMAKAANLSGKAINISKTTACHAISYPLTSYFEIPHGYAVGLTLSDILVYNSQVTPEDILDPRGVDYVKKTIAEICSLLGTKDIHVAKDKITQLINRIGLETNLSELGIKTNDIDLIIKDINLERVKNNPRRLIQKKLREMLKNIL